MGVFKNNCFKIYFATAILVFSSLASAQITATYYRFLGNIPIGISVIDIPVAGGASQELGISLTAVLAPGADPAFTILSAGCANNGFGGDDCQAVVSFTPTRLGIHNATLIGHILIPANATFPGVDETDIVHLSGNGIPAPTSPNISMNLSQSSVYPSKTSGNSTTAVIVNVTDSNGQPVPGQMVQFQADSEPYSGGHNHDDASRPIGIFDFQTCTTDSAGRCSVNYMASEVSGIDDISAYLAANASVQTMQKLNVSIPGLVEVTSNLFYRLTGATSFHPSTTNHFLTSGTIPKITTMAIKYSLAFGATLGLNDMSLPWGGLFDIGPPNSPFWQPSHNLHRIGKSVDIDMCALSFVSNNQNPQGSCPTGWIEVDRKVIDKYCRQQKGRLMNEATHHCEF